MFCIQADQLIEMPEDVEDDQIFMAKRGIPYLNRGQSSEILPELCGNTIRVSSGKQLIL